MIRGGARAHVDIDREVVLREPDVLRGSDDIGLFAVLEPALFVVDGNNLLWRAAYSPPAPFKAADGRDLTPLFRFFAKLRRVVGTYGLFAECVVCFDGPDAWKSRLDIDASYKSNRRYESVDLSFMGWLPEIRAALESADVACVELHDEEADDVIASLAALAPGRAVRILSTDRDYFQLLSESVTVVNSKCAPMLVTAATVRQRYGVDPSQWCDFRALAGDQSDGIPGVRGIGPKRAAELLEGGRTIEELDLEDNAESVRRWRSLIRLKTDVPVGITLRGQASPRLPSSIAVCRELGLV